MKWKGLALPGSLKGIWERYKYVLLVILTGVVLMMIPAEAAEAPVQAAEGSGDGEFSVERVEQKLSQALAQIRGAGDVTVVLSFQGSGRQVLAQDTQISGTEQTNSTVIVSQGAGVEQPVVLQSIYPQYQGALVVCDGGEEPEVKLKILEAMRVLTGLNSDKISICRRK